MYAAAHNNFGKNPNPYILRSQPTIRKRFGISYSRTTVKRACADGMSYKKSKSIHANRPEIDGNKSGRQRQNTILRLKRQDYTIQQQDECMVHADDMQAAGTGPR